MTRERIEKAFNRQGYRVRYGIGGKVVVENVHTKCIRGVYKSMAEAYELCFGRSV